MKRYLILPIISKSFLNICRVFVITAPFTGFIYFNVWWTITGRDSFAALQADVGLISGLDTTFSHDNWETEERSL